MTDWADIFLGIIALATLVMAAIQVGIVVYGLALSRRIDRLMSQAERELAPLTQNLTALSRDAARIGALAAGRAEHVDRLIDDLSVRIEQTATTLQDAVLKPLREGAAIMSGVKAVVDLVRDVTRRPARGRSDEDDSLFIG